MRIEHDSEENNRDLWNLNYHLPKLMDVMAKLDPEWNVDKADRKVPFDVGEPIDEWAALVEAHYHLAFLEPCEYKRLFTHYIPWAFTCRYWGRQGFEAEIQKAYYDDPTAEEDIAWDAHVESKWEEHKLTLDEGTADLENIRKRFLEDFEDLEWDDPPLSTHLRKQQLLVKKNFIRAVKFMVGLAERVLAKKHICKEDRMDEDPDGWVSYYWNPLTNDWMNILQRNEIHGKIRDLLDDDNDQANQPDVYEGAYMYLNTGHGTEVGTGIGITDGHQLVTASA